MPKERGYGQLKHRGGVWGHAKQTSAPPIVKSHEKAHSKNTLDPSRSRAPNSGQTKGG